MEKGNTVAIRDRSWQIDKTRFRSTLAGSTATIHEHLDETVSIRYGPHVMGRFDGAGEKLGAFGNLPWKSRDILVQDEDRFQSLIDASMESLRDHNPDHLLPVKMRFSTRVSPAGQ